MERSIRKRYDGPFKAKVAFRSHQRTKKPYLTLPVSTVSIPIRLSNGRNSSSKKHLKSFPGNETSKRKPLKKKKPNSIDKSVSSRSNWIGWKKIWTVRWPIKDGWLIQPLLLFPYTDQVSYWTFPVPDIITSRFQKAKRISLWWIWLTNNTL